MSSTTASTKNFKGFDVCYVSGLGHNPYQISSVSPYMWPPIYVFADGANPVENPRHEITFAYFAPEVDGVENLALAGTDHQHTKVERTIGEWERYAHVSFVRVNVAAEATIRISFDPVAGNWSEIGTLHTGANGKTMNLGGLKPEGESADNHERHIILHEFGHSLGLLHEHQSPAREGVLNIEPSCRRYIRRGWSEDMVQSEIASQNPADMITSYSKLDLDSVMAYATSGGENILQELKHELSNMDKAYMVINYPRTGERKNFVFPRAGGDAVEEDDQVWTMEHALDTAGLTVDAWPLKREEVLSRYATLDPAKTLEIRDIFGDWTKARREAERMARAARKVAVDAKAVADAAEAAAATFSAQANALADTAQEIADAAQVFADATEEVVNAAEGADD